MRKIKYEHLIVDELGRLMTLREHGIMMECKSIGVPIKRAVKFIKQSHGNR
jgi:hypothetical protein